MGISEAAFSIILNLISNVIQKGVDFGTLDFFEKRRINSRIDNSVLEVVEPLIPFLHNEGISEDKQMRLIETCSTELQPLTLDPSQLFQGSLNGQTIFENLYADKDLPQVVVEDGLKDTYALLFPRIATILCKIPAAVKEWEVEAWRENFRRSEEIAKQLRDVFVKLNEQTTASIQQADSTLLIIRKALAQRISLDLDITGLRSERPLSGKFDDFFVQPEISLQDKQNPDEVLRSVSSNSDSISEFVYKSCRAIAIGQPGAGKSTWTKWLQKEVATLEDWSGITIRIVLREYSAKSLPSLHNLVRSAAGQHYAEDITPELVRKWIESGLVSFVLDGFDEVSPKERDAVLSWILDLGTAVSQCPIVITSRPLTTDHVNRLWETWDKWMIEPFDEHRIVDYIQRWYQNAELLTDSDRTVDADNLAKSWLQDPTIGPLTSNPLLLSTLLTVHHLDGQLPNGRSQLYRRYVAGMLGLWDARRKVSATSIDIRPEHKPKILQGLALRMFFQEKDQLDEPEVIEVLKDLLQSLDISHSPKEVLATLQERSGLIIGPGIYSFVHKSVAEYLVAEAILQGDQVDENGDRIDLFCLLKNRESDRWNTVTFLWAGLASVSAVESFIEQCIDSSSPALAYGILFDQYDKFPASIRRNLLKRPTHSIDNSERFEAFFGFVRLSEEPDEKLALRFYFLRNLVQGRGGITDLLKIAFRDGTISIVDIPQLSGEKKDTFLISALFSAKKIEEIQDLINISKPDCFSWDSWVSVVIRNIIHLVFTTPKAGGYIQRKVKDCILSIAEQYSTLQIVTIVVLLEFLYEALLQTSEIAKSNSKRQQKSTRSYSDEDSFNLSKAVIDCLLFFDSVGIDMLKTDTQKQWLLETEEWSLQEKHKESLTHDEGAIDLIAGCITILKTREHLERFSEEYNVKSTVGFLKSLMRIRQGLEVS